MHNFFHFLDINSKLLNHISCIPPNGNILHRYILLIPFHLDSFSSSLICWALIHDSMIFYRTANTNPLSTLSIHGQSFQTHVKNMSDDKRINTSYFASCFQHNLTHFLLLPGSMHSCFQHYISQLEKNKNFC